MAIPAPSPSPPPRPRPNPPPVSMRLITTSLRYTIIQNNRSAASTEPERSPSRKERPASTLLSPSPARARADRNVHVGRRHTPDAVHL